MRPKYNILEELENWKLSGLSQNEYCTKRGIRYKTFSVWKNRNRSQSKSNPSFVEIPVTKSEKLENILLSIEMDQTGELTLRIKPKHVF